MRVLVKNRTTWLLPALITPLLLSSPTSVTATKLIDPCLTTVNAGSGILLACPQGDGPSLDDIGAAVELRIRDRNNTPLQYIPPSDVWLFTPQYQVALCHGSFAINGEALSDADGYMRISEPLSAGGYNDRLYVAIMGQVVLDPDDNCPGKDLELQIIVVSPDINADSKVDLRDFQLFGANFGANPYSPRSDFNGDGNIDVIDFGLFGEHYLHICE